MLRPATIQDIRAYGDKIWEMALKPDSCCYPIYYDGIKTKNDMMASLKRNIQNENKALFIFEEKGMFHGIIGYFVINEDRYIQLNFCIVQHGINNALQELWQQLAEEVKEGTVYFGFPGENEEAIAYMEENCFEKIEESWNHSFFFSGYKEKGINGKVKKVTRKDYDDFLQIYKEDDNTYWNAERIFSTFDSWNIYIAYEGNQPVSGLVLQKDKEHEEIFSVSITEGMTKVHYDAMMHAALNESKKRGVKYLTYFSEEREKGCLEKLSFRCVGKFVLYIRKM